MTSSVKNGLNIRTNETGPGVQSKRPLLAIRTRFNVLWKQNVETFH